LNDIDKLDSQNFSSAFRVFIRNSSVNHNGYGALIGMSLLSG
jgi:hypothetical protein